MRLFHLTFYKCGSQWIRDILADPRIVEYSNHRLAATGIDIQSEAWPALTQGQFASPLYSAGTGDWLRHSTDADRAIVVLRDPRDIVVSLVYSISSSHTPSLTTHLLRTPIQSASPADRIRIGMFLLAQWADQLRAWQHANDLPNVHVTRYESLLADLPGELRRLFDFLQWRIPAETIDAVAADNAFEARSGRKPGEENEFSHRRKGIAGDWRNHFDRELGQLFESTFPSLLTSLAYEASDDWWQALPASVAAAGPDPATRYARLLAVLEEHNTELATLRAAAEQRLSDVESLHQSLRQADATALEYLAMIGRLTEEVGTLTTALDQEKARVRDFEIRYQAVPGLPQPEVNHLAHIGELTVRLEAANYQIALLQKTAEERLAALNAMEAERARLEQSISWRLGYVPIRALGSLFQSTPSIK